MYHGLADIGGIDESTDKLTATIHFKDLYAGWLGFLETGPWPAAYLDSVPVAKASSLYPLSPDVAKVPFDGPFAITNASKTEIDYAPNPNWAGGVSTAHTPSRGPQVRLLAGTKRRDQRLLAGKLDLALRLNQADDPAIEKVDPPSVAPKRCRLALHHLDINNDPGHTRGNDLWDPARAQGVADGHRQGEPDRRAVPRPRASSQACSPSRRACGTASARPVGLTDQRGRSPRCRPMALAIGSTGDFEVPGHGLDLAAVHVRRPLELDELQKVQGYLVAIHVKKRLKTVRRFVGARPEPFYSPRPPEAYRRNARSARPWLALLWRGQCRLPQRYSLKSRLMHPCGSRGHRD